MTRIALLAATLVALVAAGCGGSSNDKSSSSQPAPATKAPAGTKTAATSSGGTVSIDMKNIKFDPAQQTVTVGQKVIWTNQDSVDHNVTATAGRCWPPRRPWSTRERDTSSSTTRASRLYAIPRIAST